METFKFPSDNKKVILALGAESVGNFSVYIPSSSPFSKGGTQGGFIYFSEDFDDLIENTNFNKYKYALNEFIKKNKIKPNIVITDLHPLYKTTKLGEKLAKKYKAEYIQIQHHIAHIFSAIGDKKIHTTSYIIPSTFYGIALDGTGYGLDGKIWGGEAFAISNFQFPISKQIQNSKFKKINISRIGKLEDQIMIGGDLAIYEPARMLIAILAKSYPHLSLRAKRSNPEFNRTELEIATVVARRDSLAMTTQKKFIYNFVKKFYSRKEFEVLYNQLQQNFNCIETSSTGRILDAISVLLGFCGNKRNYKHEPIFLLERNSTVPYNDLQPKIIKARNKESRSMNYELSTTYLFEYLIKNIKKDNKRLAATTQLYIAEGLYKIIKKNHNSKFIIHNTFLAGGIANNKIISSYLESKDTYKNKKIPRGDAGISFGQIIYYLSADSRDQLSSRRFNAL